MSEIMVTKRGGHREPLDLDKIHRVLTWAAEGLDVSVSHVELQSQLQFSDGINTSDIHKVLISTTESLITEEMRDYNTMAARLGMFDIRKRAYRAFVPPGLGDHIRHLIDIGRYDHELIERYSDSDFDYLDTVIDHSRDMHYPYSAYKEFESKYLVRDRVTGSIYESPQMAYMVQSMTIHCREPADRRLELVRDYYNANSLGYLSQPTPIMAGVRTPTRQYSSCVKIDIGDSIESITGSIEAIIKYVSKKAGIGINIGSNRGIGAPIAGGEALHTGVIPFIKTIEGAIHCCSQGGVRKGSATVYFPWWHYEFPQLIVLKNNKGTDENRVRHLDYAVQMNRLIYRRMKENANVSLFSPYDVPGLYEAFFSDQDRFESLYLEAENDPTVRRRTIAATELVNTVMLERSNTGRIYVMHVDHVNSHTPFDPARAPIRMSNLCIEIGLPTVEVAVDPLDRDSGEIALCTLGAINLGSVDIYTESGQAALADLCRMKIRALDNLLDYQGYPMPQARRNTMRYRPLGVGVINFAYYLAKNGVRYSDGSANQLVHDTFESIAYHLLRASVDLSRERGPCEAMYNTRLRDGVLCIDTYNRNVDSLVPNGNRLRHDWESLRADVRRYGVRNATRMALMPSETSSRIAGATNGIEPPRGLLSIKSNKNFSLAMLVPEYERLRDSYETAWEMPDTRGYLALVAIMQKFVCQLISANTYYDPARYPKGKIPMNVLIGDLGFAYKHGVKSLYYQNTKDGQKDSHSTREVEQPRTLERAAEPELEDCESGACAI